MIDEEVDAAWKQVRKGRELVGFLKQWLTVEETAFRPLPDDMLATLQTSADFAEPQPGDPPLVLQLDRPETLANLPFISAGRTRGITCWHHGHGNQIRKLVAEHRRNIYRSLQQAAEEHRCPAHPAAKPPSPG